LQINLFKIGNEQNSLPIFCLLGMVPYGNSAGNSGVVAYAIKGNGIDVQFIDGTVYTYTSRSAGTIHIKRMQQLAKSGEGLSTYISQHVKDAYEKKH